MSYSPSEEAILLVDPYSEFLGEGRKPRPRVAAIAEESVLLRVQILRPRWACWPIGRTF
jgi:hypothetical protein